MHVLCLNKALQLYNIFRVVLWIFVINICVIYKLHNYPLILYAPKPEPLDSLITWQLFSCLCFSTKLRGLWKCHYISQMFGKIIQRYVQFDPWYMDQNNPVWKRGCPQPFGLTGHRLLNQFGLAMEPRSLVGPWGLFRHGVLTQPLHNYLVIPGKEI